MLKTMGPCPSRRALRIEPETSSFIVAYLVLIWISNKLLLGGPFFQSRGFPMAPSMSAKQRHSDCRRSSKRRDLGPQGLRNVSEPVDVHEILGDRVLAEAISA